MFSKNYFLCPAVGGTVVSTSPHSKKVLGLKQSACSDLSLWDLCVVCPLVLCCVWVLSRFSSFLPQSKAMYGVRLTGDSKFAIGVNVSLSCYLSLCVSLEIRLLACPGCALLLSMWHIFGSSHNSSLNLISKIRLMEWTLYIHTNI